MAKLGQKSEETCVEYQRLAVDCLQQATDCVEVDLAQYWIGRAQVYATLASVANDRYNMVFLQHSFQELIDVLAGEEEPDADVHRP